MSDKDILFVGREVDGFHGNDFPRIRDVLCVFFYFHRTKNLTVRQSARQTVKKICEAGWKSTSIPVMTNMRCIEKVEKHFYEWKKLLKNKKRSSTKKIALFTFGIEKLFDISAKGALEAIAEAADKEKDPGKRAVLDEDLRKFKSLLKPHRLRSLTREDSKYLMKTSSEEESGIQFCPLF